VTPPSPDGRPETIRLWSLTEDTFVEVAEDGSVTVITWWGEFELPDVTPAVCDSLRRMALGPISMANVTSSADVDDEWIFSLRRVLTRLSGSVVHSLAVNDGRGPLLSVTPVTMTPVFALGRLALSAVVKLSQYAMLRPSREGLLLESPRAQYRVALAPQAALVASALAVATTAREVASGTGLAERLVGEILAFLVAAGVVLAADDRGRFAEDEDPELAPWTPTDLMFHTRSRTWQRGGPPDPETVRIGVEPPVMKQVTAGPTVPLHRPDAAALAATDPTLGALLETDHECPAFTERELTAEQVGEFLFRTARVRSVGPAYLPNGPSHEASQRPYFSVACLYELELYVTVNRCSGLGRGIYHYDPLWHTLTLINDDAGDLAAMLDMAMIAGGSHRHPSLLFTMTARMARIAWVLGSAAYATTLLHVGALQQVLSLGAKAMGLAAHAVPVDAGDRVDRALKLEWPTEVGVGECVLDFPA
jgi:SagB-type dehydrogenase family enzyme